MATSEAERLNDQIRGFTNEQIASLKANRVSGSLEVILSDQELAVESDCYNMRREGHV
jgi:hypothetical protein